MEKLAVSKLKIGVLGQKLNQEHAGEFVPQGQTITVQPDLARLSRTAPQLRHCGCFSLSWEKKRKESK